MKHVVVTDFERAPPELVERAAQTYVCLAGQAAGRHCVMDAGIKPLRHDWRFAGTALTVAPADPTDTLVSRVAIVQARPGDVIVVDAGGRMDAAAWGATMAWGAKEQGVAGIVVDGSVLTTDTLIEREGMPVFARGSTAGHVGGDGPGSINVPIVCGGVIVHPGDIVIGDADGVVVIPRAWAKELLDKVGQRRGEGYPPPGRKVPFRDRGHIDKLRAVEGIEWR